MTLYQFDFVLLRRVFRCGFPFFCEQPEDYLCRIVRLLIIYTDLELKASLRGKDTNLAVARRISVNLDLHLHGLDDNFHIFSILLQLNGSLSNLKEIAIFLYE